jgi:hypothetical protein
MIRRFVPVFLLGSLVACGNSSPTKAPPILVCLGLLRDEKLRTSSSAAWGGRKTLRINHLGVRTSTRPCKLLILFVLEGWLAALDDFRNWLIREAA